jgi:uncharacterized membrane protein YgdD (TMEM256/DUF423 family)
MNPIDRVLLGLAGMAGFVGVALAAAAAHIHANTNVEISSKFLLFHAPVLLVVPALAAQGLMHRPSARLGGIAVALGLLLFAGDLALRGIWEIALVPLAAPTGGALLLVGWATLAAAGLLGSGRSGR